MLVRTGIRLFQYWFSVTREDQRRSFDVSRSGRAEAVETVSRSAPRSLDKWDDYTAAIEADVLLHRHRRRPLDDRQVRLQEARAGDLHAAASWLARPYTISRTTELLGRPDPLDRRDRRAERRGRDGTRLLIGAGVSSSRSLASNSRRILDPALKRAAPRPHLPMRGLPVIVEYSLIDNEYSRIIGPPRTPPGHPAGPQGTRPVDGHARRPAGLQDDHGPAGTPTERPKLTVIFDLERTNVRRRPRPGYRVERCSTVQGLVVKATKCRRSSSTLRGARAHLRRPGSGGGLPPAGQRIKRISSEQSPRRSRGRIQFVDVAGFSLEKVGPKGSRTASGCAAAFPEHGYAPSQAAADAARSCSFDAHVPGTGHPRAGRRRSPP